MKKLFFGTAFFLFLLFSNLSKVSAQGSFKCQWQPVGAGGALRCTPDFTGGGCDPGYQANTSYCPQFTDQDSCEKVSPRACTSQTSSTGSSPVLITCSDGSTGIDTAIGCIPIAAASGEGDANILIGFILRWAIGIGGGIAFILILLAGFQIMTSSGNPDRLKAGKELLTSAIMGLILLVFSVFILEIIGVKILGIPGL